MSTIFNNYLYMMDINSTNEHTTRARTQCQVQLKVRGGQVLCLMGPSGVGKSTILSLALKRGVKSLSGSKMLFTTEGRVMKKTKKSMMSWFVDRDKEQEGTMGP